MQLPIIVECAQSSPQAAAEAVRAVRKRIDPKRSTNRAIQYNAIVVLRILGSSNSPTVLDQMEQDKKLPIVVSDLLRHTKDPSVKQELCDTLQFFYEKRSGEQLLQPLKAIYEQYLSTSKERDRGRPRLPHETRPVPAETIPELVQEAKSSASLLLQLVQTTAPAQISGSPLVLEFYERCVRLSSKIQSYLARDNVNMSEEVIADLIDSNEHLSAAVDAHSNALNRAASLVSPPREYYTQEQVTSAQARESLQSSANTAQRQSGLATVLPIEPAQRTQLEYTPIQPRQQVLVDPFADEEEDDLWVCRYRFWFHSCVRWFDS